MKGVVTVAARTRASNESCLQITHDEITVPVPDDRGKRIFKVNNAYNDVSQELIFNDLVLPLIDKVFQGFNSCVFAYGQTGAGKTYTIGMDLKALKKTSVLNKGLLPRSLEYIFSSSGKKDVTLSFFEVYIDEVYDLLSTKREKLTVNDFQALGLEKVSVDNENDAFAVVKRGINNRHVGANMSNQRSSRSHAICTIEISRQVSESKWTCSKLYLVDLAGSEKLYEMSGQSRVEGKSINMSLLHLGRVITALSSSNETQHIPYRSSTLTSILRDTLSSENFITLVACISPQMCDTTETLSTLNFAMGVSHLKCQPIVQLKPTFTPFKKPFTPRRNVTLASASPWKSVSHRKPLRHLNMTIDSPLGLKRKQGLKSSTPMFAQKAQIPEPNFTPLPNFHSKTLKDCEIVPDADWSALNISSSTACDSSILKVDAKTSVTNAAPSMSNCSVLNEDFIRSIILDVVEKERSMIQQLIKQEINSSYHQGIKVNRTLFCDVGESPSPPKRLRRSVRLSSVPQTPCCLPSDNGKEKVLKVLLDRVNESVAKVSPHQAVNKESFSSDMSQSQPVEYVPTLKPSIRRSTRLSIKPRKNYSSYNVSSPVIPLLQHKKDEESPTPHMSTDPQEKHNELILGILRSGNPKRLMALPTIGPKTATIICNSRLLFGPLNSLQDLKNVKGLSKNFAQRFFWANNVSVKLDEN